MSTCVEEGFYKLRIFDSFFFLVLILPWLVMEAGLADMCLDDEDEKEENKGWKVDQDVHEGEIVPNLTLVGCFLTTRAINFHSMKSTLANQWHPLGV